MRYLMSLVFIVIIVVCYLLTPASRAEVVFFNVGQGDSFLLHTPNGLNILIDGGPNWSPLYYLGRYLKNNKRTIDLLILSHSHDDHLGALPELLNRYKVKQVFLPARLRGNAAEALSSALVDEGASIVYPQSQLCLDLETNCQICIYPPSQKFLDSPDDNDLSLAINFNCSGLTVAAAGDASGQREQELITQGFSSSTQILKASHHGSATANSDYFLNLIDPKVLVISVGVNNYGHPDPKLINRAKDKGISMWRTDEQGTVLFYNKTSQLYAIQLWQ